MDNFANSTEAWNLFRTCSNIQTVGADRDYHFQRSTYYIDHGSLDIYDVSLIDPADVQACLAHIPTNLIKASAPAMRSREGREPSLFEIIENRLQGPTLQDRFGTVLSQLRRRDPLLRDLLAVIGYVDACRTPMSMDMLIAFLRGDVKDYNQIHSMMRNLGSMVSEYVDISLEDQDYYVTRSVIVGEAILKVVDGPTLGSVLWRFHDRLSPLRIANYEIFQRYAFDDRITGKAYPKWQDGVAFYDMVYAKNESYPNSYYILQQLALYCAKKHQKLEAFKRIDKAFTLSGRRKWSIRNSQAYILFEANIGLEPSR